MGEAVRRIYDSERVTNPLFFTVVRAESIVRDNSRLRADKCEKAYESADEYIKHADSFKGLEIYAWKDKGINWYAVLMPGTNRLKSVQEVGELQKELPCPLSDMRKILDFYRDSGFYDFDLSIISDPPKEDELTHDAQLIYNNFDTYEWLYSQLGLEFEYSENSENEMSPYVGL